MDHPTDTLAFEQTQPVSAEHTIVEWARICWRRRWLIVTVVAGFAMIAVVWSFAQTPIYQAKATIGIEAEGPGVLEKEAYRQDTSPEYFQTHFELLRSHQVLQQTARRLNLFDRPEYQHHPSALKQMVFSLLPSAVLEFIESMKSETETSQETETSLEDAEDKLLRQFSEHISITPVRGARLAHIIVNSEDPIFAAEAANMLASVYIERTQELSILSKEKAAQWFIDHLDELRKKVEASQQALYLFRSRLGLLGGNERQTVAGQKLGELNSELVKAEMKKAEAQTHYQEIESVLHERSNNGAIKWSNLDASAQVLNSPLIQTLRAQEIRVSGHLAELADKYGPLHPKLVRAKAELEDFREKIQQEIQKIYDSVKREFIVAVTRERAIRDAVSRYQKDKIRLEQFEIEHGILEREAQSNQHMYDIFLKVTKEADISSGMRNNNVYLADAAATTSIPVKPRKQLNLMLGLLVGLMTGVAGAVVLETRDRSLKGPDDVERYLPSTFLLGVVPMLPKDRAADGVLLNANSMGAAAESFRTIRTSLLLSNRSQLSSCILITSPGESEGKTTLAVNLATAMAQLQDTRVILIDADFRKPKPHGIFDIQTGNGKPKGLVHFLVGQADRGEIAYQSDVPNLSVVPRGDCPNNPSELLHSKHMSRLLHSYRAEGYHIILDAPPVLPVTDPVVLAPQVDGILLVVSAGATTREACRQAIHRLTSSGGKFLGIVLQKARLTDLPYYSRHGKNGLQGYLS